MFFKVSTTGIARYVTDVDIGAKYMKVVLALVKQL